MIAKTLCVAQKTIITGFVIDKRSNRSLENAVIQVGDTKTTTDSSGYFLITVEGIKKRYLIIHHQSYHPLKLSVQELNVASSVVQSNFYLYPTITSTDRIDTSFNNSANDIHFSPYQSFRGTDVAHYAGTLNDIARLPQLILNANAIDDRDNNISFRANSPLSVLWQVEGIGATYLSHFGTLGNVGGSHSILNADAVETVDVYNSSLSPDLGNNLGGTIDVQLRKGNLENLRGRVDVNTYTGAGLVLDGPFQKGSKHSYLVGFRNSINFLNSDSYDRTLNWKGSPEFNDWVFNLNTVYYWGTLSYFGYGGNSRINILGENAKAEKIEDRSDLNSNYESTSFTFGVKQVVNINRKNQWQTVLSYSEFYNKSDIRERLVNSGENLVSSDRNDISTLRVKSTIFTQINPKWSTRLGVTVELPSFASDYQLFNNNSTTTIREGETDIFQMQVYASAKYTPNDKLAISFGFGHLNFQPLNKKDSLGKTFSPITVLPRLAIAYKFGVKHLLTASIGAVDQLQSSGVYLYRDTSNVADYRTRNLLLDFNRSVFWILNYHFEFNPVTTFELTIFDQDYYNIPVDRFSSGFSGINNGLTNDFPYRTNLVSNGEGRNYGIEGAIRRRTFNNYYFTLSGAYTRSSYKGSDDIERRTAFYSRINVNVIGGKKFRFNDHNSLDIDVKISFRNGGYYTPIDAARSFATRSEVLNQSQTFRRFYPDYFRLDTKVTYNFATSGKLHQSIGFEVLNASNIDNFYRPAFNPQSQTIGTIVQTELASIFFYKLAF